MGRPEANAATARAARSLPVGFGPASASFRGATYAHPGTALIVAGENPLNPRFEVVAYAGLGADATWHAVEHVGSRRGEHPEVVLIAHGSPARDLVASPPAPRRGPRWPPPPSEGEGAPRPRDHRESPKAPVRTDPARAFHWTR